MYYRRSDGLLVPRKQRLTVVIKREVTFTEMVDLKKENDQLKTFPGRADAQE